MSYTPPPPPPPPGGNVPPPPPPPGGGYPPPPPPGGGGYPPPGGGVPAYGAGGGTPDPQGRPLAEWWERAIAAIIDGVIIGVVAAIIQVALHNTFLGLGVGFVLGTVYFGFMESEAQGGQTVGKKLLGCKTVLLSTGQPLETGQSFIRGAVKAAFWYICCIGAIVDLVLMFTDKQRQTVHDKAGATIVVKAK